MQRDDMIYATIVLRLAPAARLRTAVQHAEPSPSMVWTITAVLASCSALFTGNATLFVDIFGILPFEYNCFDPAVPPVSQSC
jgi:hypothetical protein